MPSELDDQQRILSEVSHDLANRFHRSYYYLDLLGDAVAGAEGEAPSLVERLKETVEDIEEMARGTLRFVRPIELRPLTVKLDDLVASLRQHVGVHRVDFAGDLEAGRSEVRVDPGRISEVLAYVCRVSLAAGGAEPLKVELVGGDPAGLRVHRGAGAAALSTSDLSFALAARLVRLHGGELAVDGTGASSLTLKFPVFRRES